MTKVSKEMFFRTVGQLDVVLSSIGNFPYTTIFKLRNGVEKGRIVDLGDNKGSDYYITGK